MVTVEGCVAEVSEWGCRCGVFHMMSSRKRAGHEEGTPPSTPGRSVLRSQKNRKVATADGEVFKSPRRPSGRSVTARVSQREDPNDTLWCENSRKKVLAGHACALHIAARGCSSTKYPLNPDQVHAMEEVCHPADMPSCILRACLRVLVSPQRHLAQCDCSARLCACTCAHAQQSRSGFSLACTSASGVHLARSAAYRSCR